jgi:hypothetical protein
MTRPDKAVTGERADLLETLAKHRYFLRYTVRDSPTSRASNAPPSASCVWVA